jgi:hypothetical protein
MSTPIDTVKNRITRKCNTQIGEHCMLWNVSINTTDNVKLMIEPPIINRKNIPETIRNILKL